ncbi:restriction endonuclease subunit S [Limosilactobacillus reuteri]|uniref:restriction endonuclease subunit S n=1 Tax=Limosilactobacillus reuteri TaxID=1598 RepID=UPI002B4C244A|nr:restriction endonuclease subunit S [Limosilactobacillus reuteri]
MFFSVLSIIFIKVRINVKWEQQKLGTYIIEYKKKTTKNNEYPVLTSSRKGIFFQKDYYDGHQVASKDNVGYNIVPYGYFTYRHMSDDNLFKFNINTLCKFGIVSTLYPVFTLNTSADKYFVYYYLNYGKEMQKFALIQKQGGSRTYMYLNKLRKLRFIVPLLSEQEKISTTLLLLDKLISLQQRKLEQLKQLKTAMLQQLFVNKNYKQPILRFKNFNGNWEKRKFSELATIRRGLTYKPKDVRECGKNSKRVLRSSNINENSFVIYNDDVFVDKSSINIAYVHNNDILITAANGSSKLVGKHALIHDIPDNSAVHGGFMLLASSNNPEFINALMSSPWYSRFVNNYVIGGNGAIGNLKKDDLDSQIIYTPIKNEIKKIGHFFNRLDNLIALQQNKLTQLTTLKKYLLQKLFI